MNFHNSSKTLLVFIALTFSFTANAQPIRKGIYSGTFDPPTKAHNAVIRTALAELKLDKLYIFVNVNGEKNCKCSSKERIDMLERMLSDISDKIVIIAQQSENKRADYLLVKKILDEQMIQITGEDSYARRLLIIPENRVKFDAIAIVPRHSKDRISSEHLEKEAFYLDVKITSQHASSTEVRRKIAMNDFKNIDVEPEVLSYIIEHGLYKNCCVDSDASKKRKCFEQEFYAYVGKILSPYSLPIFDPTASEESWIELFQKWVSIQKGIKR